MPDFSIIGGSETKVEMGTLDSSNTLGNIVTPNATAHTKGSWFEMNASTSFDYESIKVYFRERDTGNYFLDIGVGSAGNEEVIVSNIVIGKLSSSTLREGGMIDLPVNIPAGTRISARCQNSGASANDLYTAVQGISTGFNNTSGLSKIVDYGTTTGTSSPTLVDPGTTVNTKGSYVELTASTNEDIKTVILCVTNNRNTSTALAGFYIDIAIGASSSEVIIIPDTWFYSNTTESIGPAFVTFPVQIPAGTRIAARSQCSINDGSDRQIGLALLGAV